MAAHNVPFERDRRISVTVAEKVPSRVPLAWKLIDQEKRNLLRGLEEGRTPEDEVQRAELFLRYHTKARRDFYHALREYRILKDGKKGIPPDNNL